MNRRGVLFRPAPAWPAAVAAAIVCATASAEVADGPEIENTWTMFGPGRGTAEPTASAAALASARGIAASLGIDPADLRPDPSPPRRFLQPLHAPGGDFTLATFQQFAPEPPAAVAKVGAGPGLPVFDAELRVLIREAPGHPVVLVRSTLRPIQQPLAAVPPLPEPARLAAALAPVFGESPSIEEIAACAWVTPDGRAIPALRCVVRRGRPEDPGYSRRLLVIDDSMEVEGRDPAAFLLLDRDLIAHDASVNVSGLIASDCLPAGVAPAFEQRPLPYARITSSVTGPLYADALGKVAIPGLIPSGTVVSSSLRGQWFRVASAESPDLLVTGVLDPDGDLALIHNAGAMSGSIPDTAQVNAYIAANEVRDWALVFQPEFPGLDRFEMPINVGLASSCNAFYDGVSLNFFRAGAGCANTAYCSVVHHEYGHHLAAMAGSGQGPYGEGFGDVVAMLMRDDPGFGYGYHNDPEVPLRSGENTLTSPCFDDPHICGMVLSGAVWETRNLLTLTDPGDYQKLLTQLILASVFLHAGSEITPQITVDLLTLDDDDADIFNGTPHYPQIAAGFAAHGLDAPRLPPVGLRFPGGLPEALSPEGASFIAEEVQLGGTIDSVTLHLDVDGAALTLPLELLSPGRFAVQFPPMPCGAQVAYTFEITTTDGATVVNPMTIPPDPAAAYRAVVASAAPDLLADDFEQDAGWTVVNSGGLTDGAWQRGVPAALGDRGDPTSDYDGSGQCWLTANRCCNSDVDGGATTLTSAPLDVSAALAGGPGSLGRVELAYARWYSNETTDAPRDDALLVEISGDNGQTWMPLEVVGPEGPEVSGGWVRPEFVVSDLVRPGGGPLIVPPGLMRVRFTASDTGIGSIVEAGVDAIEVRAYPCGALCPCERDGNVEQIDVFDLLTYLDDWFEHAPAADLNQDGEINVIDLLEYLDCWFGACR
jgi:hypothetical protein